MAGFSCLLLGEEPLLLRCGEVLLAGGHQIVAVVTRAPTLRKWCTERGLRLLERDEYPKLLERDGVDVLLSITHPALISPRDFAHARLAALNFHDGPLPRYAGMNGSAWALLEGERRHAVVWHHLTPGIDEGSIVARRDVELDARETSVSLNMRNAALALDAFREVVERLEDGDLEGVPQDPAADRRLFSRHDRPAALATIDFAQPAATIDRLVRACDFGGYANRFGIAKMVHRGRHVWVREAEALARTGAPGQILALEDHQWIVGAGLGAVRLTRFATLGGVALSARDAAKVLGIEHGDTLADAGRDARQAMTRSVAEAEPYYLQALRDRIPPSLGFAGTKTADEGQLVVDGEGQLGAPFGERANDAWIAVFALALSSLCRQDTFDVALVDAPARALGDDASLFFPSVPMRISLFAESPFGELIESIVRTRTALAARGSFLFDLVARHPELASQPDLVKGEVSPVAIVVDDAELPPGAILALRIRAAAVTLVSRGRVSAAARAALGEAMASIARRIADEPGAPLSTIDVTDHETKRRQLFDWNATTAPFSDGLRIHELFERQVAEHPDTVALSCRGGTMTFAEVEEKANRVANALLECGVKPGDFVGMALPRGFGLVIAMLGIAKSGAAYVPIDASYPNERALFMLKDAHCTVLLSTERRSAELPHPRTLLLDGPEIGAALATRPQCPASSRDVCYAIYTSGTTGRPKGVVLTHRAVVNTLEWVNRQFGVGPWDRSLFVTSPGFDLSVYDVFGALGAGASLEIATEQMLADPDALAHTLASGDVTMWNSAPPALQLVLPSLPEKAPDSRLRLVLLSGDWIPVWMPDRLRAIFGPMRVESLGGATEAAIWSNHHSIGDVDPAWTSIPYGRPIQNARYYILDRRRRPLPVGIAGDLYIGGVCLAEGYLNRRELTAERFLPDPFLPGERMYATGDLARFRADGTMELLGRADLQIKVRGFRVELAEIEHAIRALPAIQDAVCTVVQDGSGQNSIVAYVVGLHGRLPGAREIRQSLAVTLPEFMIPSHVIPLSSLPVSANGKLDRKALPRPGEQAESGVTYVAPRTTMEQKIATMWESLLQRSPIGIDDDFFALGGHSLMAVMLITRLKSELGIEVPLSRVLEKPTIAGLAASLGDVPRSERESHHLLALHATGSRPPLVLVAGVGGYGFTYRNFPSLLGRDQPVYALQAIGAEDDADLVDHSIEEMAQVYECELLRACPSGPVILGGFSFGVLPAFELARRLLLRGRDVPLLVSFDGFAPGYPDLLPIGDRVRSHLSAFLRGEGEGRRAYVRERARNVRRRVLHWIGRDAEAEMAPDLPFADPALEDRLRKIWAMHMRARAAYRPETCLPCDLLLVKAGTPEQWIGTQMDDPLYGWRRFVSGNISTMTVPGRHTRVFAIDSQPFIAEALRSHIDSSLPPPPLPVAAASASA
jgi:amino acid adenylation domain-containing protein